MSKTACLVVSLGLIATGHYACAPYIHGDVDGPDAPPLASLALSTTTLLPTGPAGPVGVSVSAVGSGMPVVFDAITDVEYDTTINAGLIRPVAAAAPIGPTAGFISGPLSFSFSGPNGPAAPAGSTAVWKAAV